jgi:flagellar biosynthesis anti-sigma factor FlgM
MTPTHGIGSQQLLGALIDKTERTTQPKTDSANVAAAAKQGDAASLSGAGSLLATASNSSDVRSSKVEALKAAIEAGTYNVPAGDVADKLMQNMLG